MATIGETLRQERLRRNLELDQISRETKISRRMLEAIEAGQFDRLPGGVFTKSFVRQYARILGLDEEEMVAELCLALAPEPEMPIPPPKPAAPKIRLELEEEWATGPAESRLERISWLPALALVVVVMLACSAVYTWWQRSRQAAPRETAMVHRTVAMPAPGPAAAPAPRPAGRPQPAPPAPAPVNPNAAVRLMLTAEEATWIRVTSDGKYVFSGVLPANQSRAIEATASINLRLGNAGGVGITLNGKPLGPVGPKGLVRELEITPAGFQVVPRKPPAAEAPRPPATPL
jgi:cytoskeletal protein RodZ